MWVECRIVPRVDRRNALRGMLAIVRTLRDVGARIFHAHLNWPLGCRYELMAARCAGVRRVATSHLYSTEDRIEFGWKQHVQAAMIDRYIAVSLEIRDRLCQTLHVPEKKIEVVQNGIRVDRFDSGLDAGTRAQLTNGKERPVVFTPARLHKQKGHMFLLDAAVMIPETVFVLAGDGPERSTLETEAKKRGIGDRVLFLGQVADVTKLLASSDIFVLPSLYEGLPLSVLEAMAAGKPVVATDIGGTKEAVVNGVTGLLVPAGNSSELAVAIQKMISDTTMASRMGVAGKARAKARFSSGAMVSGVTRVYQELLGQPV